MMARMMPAIVFFGLILAFFVLLTRPDSAPETAISRPLPQLALVDHKGKAIELPQGQWLLVNFFASWCVPCVIEHPQLIELKKDLPIIGISYRDKYENMKAMLASRGNPFTAIAEDKGGAAALAFGISGVPETFLISPAGQIVWHMAGPVMAGSVDEIKEAMRDSN